jgi:hypothetical protein
MFTIIYGLRRVSELLACEAIFPQRPIFSLSDLSLIGFLGRSSVPKSPTPELEWHCLLGEELLPNFLGRDKSDLVEDISCMTHEHDSPPAARA